MLAFLCTFRKSPVDRLIVACAESSLVRQVDSPLEDSAFVAMLVGQCGGVVDLRRCVLKLF
jgi:hypothetical protein